MFAYTRETRVICRGSNGACTFVESSTETPDNRFYVTETFGECVTNFTFDDNKPRCPACAPGSDQPVTEHIPCEHEMKLIPSSGTQCIMFHVPRADWKRDKLLQRGVRVPHILVDEWEDFVVAAVGDYSVEEIHWRLKVFDADFVAAPRSAPKTKPRGTSMLDEGWHCFDDSSLTTEKNQAKVKHNSAGFVLYIRKPDVLQGLRARDYPINESIQKKGTPLKLLGLPAPEKPQKNPTTKKDQTNPPAKKLPAANYTKPSSKKPPKKLPAAKPPDNPAEKEQNLDTFLTSLTKLSELDPKIIASKDNKKLTKRLFREAITVAEKKIHRVAHSQEQNEYRALLRQARNELDTYNRMKALLPAEDTDTGELHWESLSDGASQSSGLADDAPYSSSEEEDDDDDDDDDDNAKDAERAERAKSQTEDEDIDVEIKAALNNGIPVIDDEQAEQAVDSVNKTINDLMNHSDNNVATFSLNSCVENVDQFSRCLVSALDANGVQQEGNMIFGFHDMSSVLYE